MYALASFGFGFRRSKITRNDKKILCIRQNYVLVEFFQTIQEYYKNGGDSWIDTFMQKTLHFLGRPPFE